MAEEARYSYPYSADEVFTAALHVLTFGMTDLTFANPATRTLTASTSLNAATYGENITVEIVATGEATSVVTVRSQLKFGLASWGHNRKNVEQLHANLQIYLSVVAAGAPGWFADPYGLVQTRYFDGQHFLNQNNAPMIASPPGSTPAGWYPDPQEPALQRYWDGQQWTEHTAPG